MNAVAVCCPHCRQTCSALGRSGEIVTCPTCRGQMQLPPAVPIAAASAAAGAVSPAKPAAANGSRFVVLNAFQPVKSYNDLEAGVRAAVDSGHLTPDKIVRRLLIGTAIAMIVGTVLLAAAFAAFFVLVGNSGPDSREPDATLRRQICTDSKKPTDKNSRRKLMDWA